MTKKNNVIGDIISQDVFGVREATERDFDDANKHALRETLGEIGRLIYLKLMCIIKGTYLPPGPHLEAFSLFVKSVDVLISALHMVRQRSHIEALALVRISLETASTALHIFKNSEEYEKYLNNKYKSTKAISFSKKHVPIVGELWGALSKLAVHINPIAYGSRQIEDEEGNLSRAVKLEIESRKVYSEQDQHFLIIIKLVSNIILKIAELLFFKKSEKHEGFLELIGTNMMVGGVKADNLINKYYQQFLEASHN